jgi:hypothetical protein
MIDANKTSGTSPGTKNKPSPPLTPADQAILNALRFSKTTEELRERDIDLDRVDDLVRQRRIKSERYEGGFPTRKTHIYLAVVSEQFPFPFRCTGSFCHQLNFIDDRRHKLCRPCRDAKLRHNKTERTHPKNVSRANRTRRIRRYNHRMEHINRFPWLINDRPRGVELFRRVLGWTRQEATSFVGTDMKNVRASF